MTTLSMRLRNGVAGRWARLTWAWVGACAVMIGSVGCNAARLGPDDPECPTAELCTTMGPSPTLVRVQVSPSTVTLESLNGSRPTQQFVVTGVRADGSMTGPLQAVFNAPGAGVGAVDGNSGLFTATGEVGGVVMGTATVMAGGSPRMASFQITVNVTKEILAPGAPADAGMRFAPDLADPLGSDVRSLAASSGALWAGTVSGVFRGTDLASAWTLDGLAGKPASTWR